MNHVHYASRLQKVEDVVVENFHVKPLTIEPLAYDKECPFPYNNFVYHVTFTETNYPIQYVVKGRPQPGTSPLPAGSRNLIIRLTNSDADGLSGKNRVQNEVACMCLARRALPIVPNVYGWKSVKTEQGWMAQEFMRGVTLQPHFVNLTAPMQKEILLQLATILASLQNIKLPRRIEGYGGLTYDEEHGTMIGGEMTTLAAGPFQSAAAKYKAVLGNKLEIADKSHTINGWRANDIRRRLDGFASAFIASPSVMWSDLKPTLVHGDLTFDNILFDPKTNTITALLDFDFAHIGTQLDEHFCSFGTNGGRLPDWGGDEEQLKLRRAMLHGFPPASQDEVQDAHWTLARAWSDTMDQKRVAGLSRFPGAEEMADANWLSRNVAPWMLTNPVVTKAMKEEKKESTRTKTAALLERFLTQKGY